MQFFQKKEAPTEKKKILDQNILSISFFDQNKLDISLRNANFAQSLAVDLSHFKANHEKEHHEKINFSVIVETSSIELTGNVDNILKAITSLKLINKTMEKNLRKEHSQVLELLLEKQNETESSTVILDEKINAIVSDRPENVDELSYLKDWIRALEGRVFKLENEQENTATSSPTSIRGY